jgi:WD40 repeat protein
MPKTFSQITSNLEVIYPRYDPQKFVARKWLIKEAARFRDELDRRHLIIVGKPGSGKSTFLAYLAETWNCPRYFIRADNRVGVVGLDARTFLVSIGAQLYQKYGRSIFQQGDSGTTKVTAVLAKDKAEVVGRFIKELYTLPFLPPPERNVEVRAGIITSQAQVVGERIDQMVTDVRLLDESTLLQVAVLSPVNRISELYPEERVLILIDALDESSQHPGTPISDVIPRASDPGFPSNLRILMTSRQGNHLAAFRAQDILFLDDKEKGYHQESLKDARRYIQQRRGESPLKESLDAWEAQKRNSFLSQVETKSDGNFLYLYHFFNAAAGTLTADPSSIEDLRIPEDLDEIYRFFALERIRKGQLESLTLTLTDKVSETIVTQFQFLEGVKGVQVDGPQVTVLAESLDQVQWRLFEAIAGAGLAVVDSVSKRKTELGIWESKYLPVLGILSVVYEGVSREQLAGFAGVELAFVDSIRAQIGQFLDVVADSQQERYRLYHNDFAEYLLDPRRNKAYPLDGPAYHAAIVHHYLDTCRGRWDTCDEYGLRHLLTHLMAGPARVSGGQQCKEDLLADIVTDIHFLEVKAAVASVYAALADLQLGARTLPVHHGQKLQIDGLFQALDREAHHLVEWDREWDPVLFAQQLHYGAMVLGLSAVAEKAATILEHKTMPYTLLCWFIPGRLHPQKHLLARGGAVQKVMITADGHYVVYKTQGDGVWVWELARGGAAIPLESSTASLLAVDEEEERVIIVVKDRLWARNLHDATKIPFSKHKLQGEYKVLSPNRRYAAAVGADGVTRVWDITTGDVIPCFGVREHSRVRSIALSNRWLVIGFSNGVYYEVAVWDLNSGELLYSTRDPRPGGSGNPVALAVSADERHGVIGCGHGPIVVWELETGRQLVNCLPPLGGNYGMHGVYGVAITPDGRRVAFSDTAGGVWVLNWAQERDYGYYRVGQHGCAVTTVAITPDGCYIAAGSDDGVITIWDVNSALHTKVPAFHQALVRSVSVSRDGRTAVTAAGNGPMKVWDVTTGRVRYTLGQDTDSWRCPIIGQPPGLVIACNRIGPKLSAWDLEVGQKAKGVYLPDTQASALAMLPDGRTLVIGTTDLNLYSLYGGRIQRLVPDGNTYTTGAGLRPPPAVTALAVSADGRYMLAGFASGDLWLFDLTTGGDRGQHLQGHPNSVLAAAITFDGHYAITGCAGGILRVFDLRGNKSVWVELGYPILAIANHGRHVITGSASPTLGVWDQQAREWAAGIPLDGGWARVALSDAGDTLIVGDNNGNVYCFRWFDPRTDRNPWHLGQLFDG